MKQATTEKFDTHEQKWNALVERNGQADGSFFYAVKTTGVFCRPSCRSRLPKQANVRFFRSCDEAERAGYRACKKCTPKTANLASVPPAVVRACERMEAAQEPLSLDDLAAAAGLSKFHFQRLFKSALGVTPKAYAAARRAQRFQDELRGGNNVTAAIYKSGFGSTRACYESALDELGMTPAQYKNGGVGLVIRFAVAKCYLGRVLVAATQKGICVIEFADTEKPLTGALKRRFPHAELRSDDPRFAALVQKVLACIETPRQCLDLPLDVQGTAFQRRVWQALQTIPLGSTRTYSQIAQRIGRPSAIRAVASACAANTVAVAIPCHRAVRKDGEPGGYRWGPERKQAILDCEAQAKTK